MNLNTLKAMQKNMVLGSDEPGDLRGIQARAVAGMIEEIERLTAENVLLQADAAPRTPIADVDPTAGISQDERARRREAAYFPVDEYDDDPRSQYIYSPEASDDHPLGDWQTKAVIAVIGGLVALTVLWVLL